MPATSGLQLERYDATAIANHYQKLPLRVWWRCLSIFVPLVWLYVTLWWDRKTGQTEAKASKRAVEVRKLLTKLGPAFIKIGQALSTRPDIVPPVYLSELAQLQDQLPAFSNEQAFQFILEELGSEPHTIYAEISDYPIAAASLGQVYKGKLHSGETVAIKVQRPDIADGIALDMYILRGLSAWAKQNFKFIRSDLAGILDEFASRIFEEMDYIHEGHNAERFAEFYGDIPGIYIPKIYWKYTAKRVLTMEWIEGIKLTDIERVKAQGFDSRQIIEVGVQCSLRQLLDRGFFHADPHPGNLLVMFDGKLAYIDFGMMSQVGAEQRFGLIEAIVHLVNRDFDALSKDYVQLGFLTPDVDFNAITPALAKVFNEALGASVAELNFKNITDQLSQIMYDYPFQVPAYYALIIRSLVTLEGIALGVDPQFKVLSVAYPYVANRLLTDSSPELRAALKDLLFRDNSFRWNRLENLLRNAKANSDFDTKDTVDRVVDFLLSDRGEYIRDQLANELVKGLEAAALSRLPNPFGNKNNTEISQPSQPSSLEHLNNILAILQGSDEKQWQPMQLLPFAGRILLKPETQAVGRNVISQLFQRALARSIRELLLRDDPEDAIGQTTVTTAVEEGQTVTTVNVVSIPVNGAPNPRLTQSEPLEPVGAVRSPIRREVNGRTW